MASTGYLTRNNFQYPSDPDPNDDLMRYDSRNEFEHLLRDQIPSYQFDENPELALYGFDSICSNTFNNSSWPSTNVENVQYQGERAFPLETATIFQGGSGGQRKDSQNSGSHSVSLYEGHHLALSPRAERSRGLEIQPAECSQCQRLFDSLQLLEQHTIKESHKVWRCLEENCGKTYPRRDSLSKHKLKHSAKGHACTECQKEDKRKVFKRRDHLAEHIRKRHSPSTDRSNDDQPRKQSAMQNIVKSLGTVLGEGHQKLQGLEDTMTLLSNSKMESVAETIADGIAQITANPGKGFVRPCQQLKPEARLCTA